MVAYPDVLADGWESYGCCEHLEGARPARGRAPPFRARVVSRQPPAAVGRATRSAASPRHGGVVRPARCAALPPPMVGWPGVKCAVQSAALAKSASCTE